MNREIDAAPTAAETAFEGASSSPAGASSRDSESCSIGGMGIPVNVSTGQEW